ncbi:MAG: winged helix-turn-helix transcriptional regulator [Proteobacteria bacterium]|nr:winged helix-turn-helix transcriptional regulator [Pseudomonadota bacterium]
MPETPTTKSTRDEAALVLGVLSAVEHDSAVTQRGLSSDLGIALGLANAVLKRCVRKGLIKIANVPLNRYAYYLTPQGLIEKGRLTVEYLRVSFDLFRDARRQFSELMCRLAESGAIRVALVGVSELTEAALLSARESGVEVVCVIDPAHALPQYLGVPALQGFDAIPDKVDALLICDLRDPLAVYEAAQAAAPGLGIDRGRVLAPALLRLNLRRARQKAEVES